MPIRVDENGDGIWDKELDDDTVGLPPITDKTGDGKLDVDLTTANSSAVINGAVFLDAANIGAGTGNYNTFLAIQDDNDPGSVEEGFNTDDKNPLHPSNDEIDQSKTETILLGSIPITYYDADGDGIEEAYYEFRVDLNESNSSPDTQISLDSFQLYASQDGTIEDLAVLQGQTKIYDMDAGQDVSVLLSEANSSGSGNDDYSVLVPVEAFGNADPATTYVYLYVKMGEAGATWTVQGGFEEWNLQNAVILQGTKFEDTDGDGVRDDGEGGLGGVKIFIDNDLDGIVEATDGNGVLDPGERFTFTNADGSYSFGSIPLFDSSYTIQIREVVPDGYVRTTGDFETVLISSNADAGDILQVDPIGNKPLTPSIDLDKEIPEIEGGVGLNGLGGANSAGDKIIYQFTVTNDGELDLTNVVLTDPNIDIGSLVRGDDIIGDNDNILEVGEVWSYTASHTVTQAELDSNGNDSADGADGDIDNTAGVTGDSARGQVSDSDSEDAPLVRIAAIDVVKSVTSIEDGDDFGGTGQVDSPGDVINYLLTISNEGNYALSGVTMEDQVEGYASVDATPVDDGFGYNIGDLDQDNLLDVNETWQYTASYTVTQEDIDSNGFGDGDIDNIATGDTAETGPDTDVEAVPIVDAPAIKIVKDAESSDPECTDAGDTITYTYTVTNEGNVSLDNVVVVDDAATPGDDTDDFSPTYVSGDTDADGELDVGETWTYTAQYVVTQADVDGGGPIVNTATANGDSVASGDAAEESSDDASVELCDDPAIKIVKDAESSDPECTDAGDTITYTYTVTNEGNVSLDNVVVVDDAATPGDDTDDFSPTYVSGDTDADGELDVGETWTYTAQYVVTQADVDANSPIVNTATANAVSVASGDAAEESSDDASVDVCWEPAIDVEKLVSISGNTFDPVLDDHDDPTGPQATTANTPIYFLVSVANIGNVTLTALDFSDILSSPAGSVFAGELNYADPSIDAWVDLNDNGSRDANEDWALNDVNADGVLDTVELAPGETIDVYYTMPFEAGQHINTVTVTTAEGVSDSDAAHYFGLNDPGSGVRTPGFWQGPNNGLTFWDGIADNQAHDGEGFPDGDPSTEGNQDLLYAVDSNGDGVIDGADKQGLLVGDYNGDGLGTGEDVFFISLADAQALVDASTKSGNDVISKMGRDVVATWLNFLAGNSLGDGSEGTAKHYLDDAIDWMQSFADGTPKVSELGETFDDYVAGSRIKTSENSWKSPQGDSDHSGADIHNALAEYNEGGTVNGVFIAGDGDSAAFQAALSDAVNSGLFMVAPIGDDPLVVGDGMTIAIA